MMVDYGVSLGASNKGSASNKGVGEEFHCMLVEVLGGGEVVGGGEVLGDWEFGGNRSDSLRMES
jgi:hypothetical protein